MQETNVAAQSKEDPFLGLHYMLEPDYSRSCVRVSGEQEKIIRDRVEFLYGKDEVDEVYTELERAMAIHHAHMTKELISAEDRVDPTQRFTEKDVVLITYGNLVVSQNKRPIMALAEFVERMFRGLITTLHILPFFPYSSDRGFSVIEYGQVDPELGTWNDVSKLKDSFRLMFDGVINHCSRHCKWFRRFLSGDPKYRDYFVVFDSEEDLNKENLSKIFRPRTSPLLTKFYTLEGEKYVWTTFSEDQVDLNFKNPKVLIKIFRILLGYVRRGADIIRLDAITYLWRELGTNCIHLDQTHEVVKLLRDVLNVVAPHVSIITETNVPHSENITYFGDGTDEAQMVYNFALPPLVLHTFLTGNAEVLTGWAAGLDYPSKTTSFFNFLDSHDGIGLMGARGFLTDEQITNLCSSIKERGGYVSMKSDGDGNESPYELNTTWFSALNPDNDEEPEQIRLHRFVASRAVALVLRGVPGIYMLSMFAQRNDYEAVERDGVFRSINRSSLYEEKVSEMFLDRNSVERKITTLFTDMLEVRVSEPAFHPNGEQEILDLGPGVFSIIRTSEDGGSKIFCLINVTDNPVEVEVETARLGMGSGPFEELLQRRAISDVGDKWKISLKPYQVAWYK